MEDERAGRDRKRRAGAKHDRPANRLRGHERNYADINHDRRLQVRGHPGPDVG